MNNFQIAKVQSQGFQSQDFFNNFSLAFLIKVFLIKKRAIHILCRQTKYEYQNKNK